MNKLVNIENLHMGETAPLVLIAGPCVIESEDRVFEIASSLKTLTDDIGIPLIFKASYDKANRTSIHSFRGPGPEEGLKILGRIKRDLGVRILSDVHRIREVEAAAEVLDVIQVPAFLCRQTDLILEVAKTGKTVNIKKGQFLAPWDVLNVVEKVRSVGNDRVVITERGVMFGYNNLVVDFRGIVIMQKTGCPVVFDATHSVQLPGGAGTASGGQREFAPILARAAVAAGVDGVFLEVHTDPDHALCDGPNSLRTDALAPLLVQLMHIREAAQATPRLDEFPSMKVRGGRSDAGPADPAFTEKLKAVRLLLLDVDGVLTDGQIVYTDQGHEIKSFNVRDGLGIRMVMDAGIQVGIVTARTSDALRHRCRNLRIDLLFDGVDDKRAALETIVEKTGIPAHHIAVVGDDILDLPLMQCVGLSVAVSDAHGILLEHADMVTTQSGGRGAVREVCEALLNSRDTWGDIMGRYLGNEKSDF